MTGIVFKARFSGKTSDMVEKIKRDNRSVLVVMNDSDKQEIVRTDPRLALQVKTINELQSINGMKINKIYIDDFDLLLNDKLIPVEGISINKN